MVEVTGGCQCGRVRYAVTLVADEAYLCHCRMCQRAVGAVSVALTQVACASVAWTTHAPERFRSSPFAQRGFCAVCGTSLTYEADGEPMMDLTVGSFDEPSRFRPVAHYGIESWHPQWLDTRGLPTQSTDQNERIAGKWIETCGKLPD